MNIDLRALMHPGFADIEAFAIGSPPEEDRAKIVAHLRECARCQSTVHELRALRTLAQDVIVPPMSSDLRARVLDQGRSGAVRILPAVAPDSGPRRHFPIRRLAYSAAAAALVAVVVLAPHGNLAAGPTAGTLVLSQTLATSAPMYAVRYTPAMILVASDTVVLLAETYVARKPGPSNDRTYTLARCRDGAFGGTVTLPAGTAYARYSVASRDRRHVDDNDARGWGAAVHDSADRPLFEGLWLERVLNGWDDWERAAAIGVLDDDRFDRR